MVVFWGSKSKRLICSGTKKSLVNPLHQRCLTTFRVLPKAHHWRQLPATRHQHPLSRTQQLGALQLDHLRQHLRGHQGHEGHVEGKTRSIKTIDMSFTRDLNSSRHFWPSTSHPDLVDPTSSCNGSISNKHHLGCRSF